MNVENLMTAVKATVPLQTEMSEVITLMYRKRVSCVLVCDNDYIVGIITERDIVRVLAESLYETKKLTDVLVTEVMSADPLLLNTSTTLFDALRLARKHQLRHFPVVNSEQKLVGLITQTDMTHAYLQLMERQLELEADNKELQDLSNEDPLMKIGNRRAMESELDYIESSSVRYGKTYALALIDVDFFKKYNDRYGHQDGDEALIMIADAIKFRKREADKLYRYGGEELLLLMPEADEQDALTGADRIRQEIESTGIEHIDSPFGTITVSVGVVSRQSGKWQDMIEAADKALYRAKSAGRNMVCVAA